MSFFYGVYPAERSMRTFLSLLRYIVQPAAIRSAHITLRGPYEEINPAELTLLRAEAVGLRAVTILQPISFFSEKQCTVALEVDVGPLRRLWDKPNYPDGTAHITMYDGDDLSEARWVYDALGNYDWRRPISVSEIAVIERKAPADAGLLEERLDIYDMYASTANLGLPPLDRVVKLPFAGRMSIYGSLLRFSGGHDGQTAYLLRA